MLPDLSPDSLYVFTFGPGTGELVAVRAPPDDWLIVDGCSGNGVGYGAKLLEHYSARPSIIVLTHPHTDHARGLGDVIDVATPFASQRLPRFEADEGAQFLLARSPELLLTGLPRAYADQGVNPQRAARSQLDVAGRSGPRQPRVEGFPDCCCVVELRRDGTTHRNMGPGSIVATP